MIAEGTAPSFAEAKRKAAEALGHTNARNLPENLAVQEALIEYQRLFEGVVHAERIHAMRREALRAMDALVDFEPRLVGPVLYGSACDYSPVTLHLYTDEPESLARHLHDLGIAFRLDDTRLRVGAKAWDVFPVYRVMVDDLEFELVVMPLAYLAHPPLSSLDGRPYKRADPASLTRLLAESAIADPTGAPG